MCSSNIWNWYNFPVRVGGLRNMSGGFNRAAPNRAVPNRIAQFSTMLDDGPFPSACAVARPKTGYFWEL